MLRVHGSGWSGGFAEQPIAAGGGAIIAAICSIEGSAEPLHLATGRRQLIGR
jgi:hypothetical protein